MVLAAVGDTTYNVVLMLHIIAVIVGFAPAAVHPILDKQLQSEPAARQAFLRHAAKNGHRVYLPSLTVAGIFGIGLILLSDDAIEFSQLWISLSFLAWFALLGVVAGVILPGEKAAGAGDLSKEKRVQVGGQIASLLLLVLLYLMVFKPGL